MFKVQLLLFVWIQKPNSIKKVFDLKWIIALSFENICKRKYLCLEFESSHFFLPYLILTIDIRALDLPSLYVYFTRTNNLIEYTINYYLFDCKFINQLRSRNLSPPIKLGIKFIEIL